MIKRMRIAIRRPLSAGRPMPRQTSQSVRVCATASMTVLVSAMLLGGCADYQHDAHDTTSPAHRKAPVRPHAATYSSQERTDARQPSPRQSQTQSQAPSQAQSHTQSSSHAPSQSGKADVAQQTAAPAVTARPTPQPAAPTRTVTAPPAVAPPPVSTTATATTQTKPDEQANAPVVAPEPEKPSRTQPRVAMAPAAPSVSETAPPAAAPTTGSPAPGSPAPGSSTSGSLSVKSKLAAQQIELGRQLFGRGQVLRARETFLVAISSAPADILYELGRTFDPTFLEALSASDAKPDPQRALSLYQEAVKHGSAMAPVAVERLRRDFPGLQ